MKILKGHIDWMGSYMNEPRVYVALDQKPKHDEMVYEEKNGLYYAEKDGIVDFLFHDPRYEEGYGRRGFSLKMVSGATRTIVGPWSSNSEFVNSQGFGPCFDVAYANTLQDYKNGWGFCSSAVTVEFLKQHANVITANDYVLPPRDYDVKGCDGKMYFKAPEFRFKFPAGHASFAMLSDFFNISSSARPDSSMSRDQSTAVFDEVQDHMTPVWNADNGDIYVKASSKLYRFPHPGDCSELEIIGRKEKE